MNCEVRRIEGVNSEDSEKAPVSVKTDEKVKLWVSENSDVIENSMDSEN